MKRNGSLGQKDAARSLFSFTNKDQLLGFTGLVVLQYAVSTSGHIVVVSGNQSESAGSVGGDPSKQESLKRSTNSPSQQIHSR
jgi:hypothetical protein